MNVFNTLNALIGTKSECAFKHAIETFGAGQSASHASHANFVFKSKHTFQIALINTIKQLAFNNCVTRMLTRMARHVDSQPWLA